MADAEVTSLAGSLFADLGPLIALFGEDFAKQYMSESSTWREHIIFAMVPIGVLPAIVSAIRVSGPEWLRAMIGKAREDRGTVEAELMSSTSSDVAEIYDGGAFNRTTGDVNIE